MSGADQVGADRRLRSEQQHRELAPVLLGRRVLVIIGIVIAVVLLLLFLWVAIDILLLIFAGTLLAILLRTISNWISRYTRLGPGLSLTAVVLALFGLLGVGGWLLIPAIAAQLSQIAQQLPIALDQLRAHIETFTWGPTVLEQTPEPDVIAPDAPEIVTHAAGIFTGTLSALGSFVIILFIGLYLAAAPDLYRRGFLHLIPVGRRRRAEEVLDNLAYTLRWWLLGQLVSMTVVCTLTTLGLWLLGVPLALGLGILAGLAEFVPTFGPFFASLPSVLFALIESPQLAIYVIMLYVGIQTFDAYLLTPMVQHHAVKLPPVITMVSIILGGALLGVLGFVLATPLAAVVLVLVKMLYVEDVLGDPTSQVRDDAEGEAAQA
jgi:predicted PurR-regulated permease PerM